MARRSEGIGDPPSLPFPMVVAAHPDDEVIGIGGRLPTLKGVRLIHLTDGAPRDPRDAEAAGFRTREDYGWARRSELNDALRLAGIGPERCLQIGLIDQEASLHLRELAVRLAGLLSALQAGVVFTHPYEGGHPDHDAAALGVHAACRLLERRGVSPPALFEFTSYHVREGRLAVFDFLPAAGDQVTTIVLPEEVRLLKRKMLGCFATQQKVLASFPVEIERFRPAPRYDFSRPPHPGRLHYESFEWGMNGERWRGLAREALDALGLEGAL
ncbi:MAG TPA: PIG-L family deacetylase [Candidatus Manganitrophaceae bacterium]|nr:PIG-L family deacetylase [Candidatus Manganitrophaceae bacterium]